jgi:hypothetical protein
LELSSCSCDPLFERDAEIAPVEKAGLLVDEVVMSNTLDVVPCGGEGTLETLNTALRPHERATCGCDAENY